MLDLKTVAERLAKPELEVMQQSLRAYSSATVSVTACLSLRNCIT